MSSASLPALAQVSYEGKEVRGKAPPEARIDFQQKRLALRHLVIHATKTFELHGSQHPGEQIQIGATMNDLESIGVLSFDRRVDGKLVFDIESFDDYAFYKQDVCGELR